MTIEQQIAHYQEKQKQAKAIGRELAEKIRVINEEILLLEGGIAALQECLKQQPPTTPE